MSKIAQAVADTLSQKPEVGIFGSMVGVALSPVAIISLLSAVFGLIVTVITLVIKVMDMYERIHQKKKAEAAGPPATDEIIIGGKHYKLAEDGVKKGGE